jgi:uncharacterized DUF497 family protein
MYNCAQWLVSNGTQESRKQPKQAGVHFADAVAVFEDDRAITIRDDSGDDERSVTAGMDGLARVVIVAYTWRGESIRVISARLATPTERDHYLVNT